MHRLLQRQLKKFAKSLKHQKQLASFLDAIDNAYRQSDEDRKLLERSLEITSQELVERNLDLKKQLANLRCSEMELTRALSLLRSTLEVSMEAVLVIDPSGKPTIYNNNFLDLCGLRPNQMENITSHELYCSIECLLKTPNKFAIQRQHFINSSKLSSMTHKLRNGRVIEVKAAPHKQVGLIWSFRDISEKYQQEERITHQAHHDSLTGLPNRVLLNDRINQATRKLIRRKTRMALFYLDLDGFKKINDSLGHEAGDCILIVAAKRLQEAVRDEDTVGRIGGDEFVVLLEEIDSHKDVVLIANKLLNVFATPIQYKKHELYITTSIGIALFPDDGLDTSMLLKNADIALYKAKDEGRNRFHFFTASLERLAKHRMSIEMKLRQAVANKAFEIYYQPEFQIKDGKLIGFEALIRWPTPDGFITPDTFIPIAESTGLILPLGDWIIIEVCKQLKRWEKEGFSGFSVAVNLSPRQFQHQDIFHSVMSCLQQHELSPKALAIEITENMIIDNVETASRMLSKFQQFGIKVCMDDFGTGYASLNYLKNLPIDVLKIDRSFIHDMTESKQNRAIAASIISLGHNLGHKIIAEGVETEKQLHVLGELHCDIAQGFLLGRPLPAEKTTMKQSSVIHKWK